LSFCFSSSPVQTKKSRYKTKALVTLSRIGKNPCIVSGKYLFLCILSEILRFVKGKNHRNLSVSEVKIFQKFLCRGGAVFAELKKK